MHSSVQCHSCRLRPLIEQILEISYLSPKDRLEDLNNFYQSTEARM